MLTLAPRPRAATLRRARGDPAHPDAATVKDSQTLADRIEDLLPQTQCTKCGYNGCRPYAEAIAAGTASYNQCPPGGAEGVARLAKLLGKPVIPINPVNGAERPRPVAFIDESLCIGCTLCMQACPVDAIVGAPKQMHTIVKDLCTGCDLCVAPCPVDCIAMIPITGTATGWDAWTQEQADEARVRYGRREARLASERDAAEARAAARRAAASPASSPASSEAASAASAASSAGSTATAPGAATPGSDAEAKKKAIIEAALERARRKKAEMAERGVGPRNTENVSADVQAQIDAAEARRHRLGVGESAQNGEPAPAPHRDNTRGNDDDTPA
ncbi:MAG: electron transport complex subunit RsxB [Paraburkholderia sp.]|nr:MAG: electron transport complex subunit RsxB [Paraburkholderia sp.]TAM28759.1 MAG: electron transport complex subunit RsxB [Paraburkholderia sp.]